MTWKTKGKIIIYELAISDGECLKCLIEKLLNLRDGIGAGCGFTDFREYQLAY